MNYFWMESGKNLVKMGRLHKLTLPIILLSLFFICSSFTNDVAKHDSLNNNTLINLNRGLQAFGFRTQRQWDELADHQLLHYTPDTFSPGLWNKIPYLIYPYWQGDQYKNYFCDNIGRIGYLGYIIDPFTGNPALTYSWTVSNIADFNKNHFNSSSKIDLILYCGDKNETDIFLSSGSARDICIKQLIKLTDKRDSFPSNDTIIPKLCNADGINVFFPEFSFEKKREFGLLIKDLFWKYRHGNDSKKLVITFPLCDTINYPYIEGLNKYIDEVYFANYDYTGMNMDTAATSRLWKKFDDENYNISIIQEMFNEIRIAKFYNPFDNSNDDSSDPERGWLTYLMAIGAIILLFLIVTILFFVWGKVNQLIVENFTIVFLLGALLFTEMIFLFLFMVEKMNFDTWLINLNNPGSKYFLALPLLLILLFPVIKILQGRKHLP
jgi:hypothetical protein